MLMSSMLIKEELSMDVKDYNYEILLDYIETGAKGQLTDDMVEYLNILETMRSMYSKFDSPVFIKRFFTQKPYELSDYIANKRFNEMLNFFYSNNDIKKAAWRNAYAEKLDKAADLVMATAKNSQDLEVYQKLILSAAKMRALDQIDPPEIPKALYDKPTKIYTFDPRMIGREKVDRNVLAKQIDSLDIPVADKNRIKGDAMIQIIEFLEEDGEEEDN